MVIAFGAFAALMHAPIDQRPLGERRAAAPASTSCGQRRGPPAAGVPVLAPAARGCPAMLATPAPRRNSLCGLRPLRSDSRRESEVRRALRARAGAAALLGCAQARPRRAARAFAVTVAVFVVYTHVAQAARGGTRRTSCGQRCGPPAAGAPVLALAARGCPAMLATPAPRRNPLRGLRPPRWNSRRESEVRRELRARAGAAALLGCAQARPRRAARAFAMTAARLRLRSLRSARWRMQPSLRFSARTRSTLPERRAAAHRRTRGGRSAPLRCSSPAPTMRERQALAGRGDVCGAEQRSLGVGARSALRTSDSRRSV